jgi:hypothetical protein
MADLFNTVMTNVNKMVENQGCLIYDVSQLKEIPFLQHFNVLKDLVNLFAKNHSFIRKRSLFMANSTSSIVSPVAVRFYHRQTAED